MNFYSFEEIRAAGSCLSYVRDCLGLEVKDNRCAAVWRAGTNPNSVALTDESYYDHSRKEGGGIVELCAISRFGGDKQQAQEFLGNWLRLTPKNKTKVVEPSESRYMKLLAEGYTEAARYYYKDDAGNVRHIVVKLTHPKKHKEFLQRTPERWGVKGVDLVLYNMEAWLQSPWIVVVEGEKDVETLKAWGIPATTNCGGAEKWHENYNERFDGKDVVVCIDNDEAGRDHGRIVLKNLARHARSLRLVCPSIHHKGDVTDWRDSECGTPERFYELIKNAQEVPPDLAEGTAEEWARHAAKKANATALRNTERVKKETDAGVKWIEVPRKVNELVKDIHTRFLGFPRKIGDSRLFDHDRDNNEINWIDKASGLFAWIGAKSQQEYLWSDRTEGCVCKSEIYEALRQQAIRYESISRVPDWPRRNDVYYAHGKIPECDSEHKFFNTLCGFFAPANDASRTLIRALFAAPVFFQRGIPRPCWVIDSEDGAGTGKTTIVELVSQLYGCSPVKTSKQELARDFKELIKRLVSSDGRNSRVLLVDNVVGQFDIPEFADLVTCGAVSGKAPYGYGEETRPNNLTYVITSNSATCNNDISSRSFFIFVKRPQVSDRWKERVQSFIEEYRYQIFSDLLDILNKHKTFASPPVSRFPEFETRILQAMCETEEEYDGVCRYIMESRSEANVEEELAKQVEETIRFRLNEMGMPPDSSMVFIRTAVIDRWLIEIGDHGVKMQDVRNFAKIGVMRNVDKNLRRFPANEHGENKGLRRSGIMWIGDNSRAKGSSYSVAIIGQDGTGKPAVVKAICFSAFDAQQPDKPEEKKVLEAGSEGENGVLPW